MGRAEKKYNTVDAKTICDAITECGSVEGARRREMLPVCVPIIMRWCRENPEFFEEVQKARKTGMEIWADKSLELALESEQDVKRYNKNGEPVINFMSIRRTEVIINTIWRVLASLDPKYSVTYKPQEPKCKLAGFAKAETASEKIKILSDAVANGKITPTFGESLARFCDYQLKIEEMAKLEERLKALEKSE
jgi:hypothetical protein